MCSAAWMGSPLRTRRGEKALVGGEVRVRMARRSRKPPQDVMILCRGEEGETRVRLDR